MQLTKTISHEKVRASIPGDFMRFHLLQIALLPALLFFPACFSDKKKASKAAATATPQTTEDFVAVRAWCSGNVKRTVGQPSILTRYRFRKSDHSLTKEIIRYADDSTTRELTVYPRYEEVARLQWQLSAQSAATVMKLELKPFDRDSHSWAIINSAEHFDSELRPESEPKFQLEITSPEGENEIAYACGVFSARVANTRVNRSYLDEQVRNETEFKLNSRGDFQPEQMVTRNPVAWPVSAVPPTSTALKEKNWCRVEMRNGRSHGNVKVVRFLEDGKIDLKWIVVSPAAGGTYDVSTIPFAAGTNWEERNSELFSGRSMGQDEADLRILQDRGGHKLLAAFSPGKKQIRPYELFVECGWYREADGLFHFLDWTVTEEEMTKFLAVKGNAKFPNGW